MRKQAKLANRGEEGAPCGKAPPHVTDVRQNRRRGRRISGGSIYLCHSRDRYRWKEILMSSVRTARAPTCSRHEVEACCRAQSRMNSAWCQDRREYFAVSNAGQYEGDTTDSGSTECPRISWRCERLCRLDHRRTRSTIAVGLRCLNARRDRESSRCAAGHGCRMRLCRPSVRALSRREALTLLHFSRSRSARESYLASELG